MFHQVFICNSIKDENCSEDPLLDKQNGDNTTTLVKKENSLEKTTTGFIGKGDIKIAVQELKSEQNALMNGQMLMETDIQIPQGSLETKSIISLPHSNPIFTISSTDQFILPLAAEQSIQPLQTTLISSPSQMVIQQPQEAVVAQAVGPTLVYNQPSVGNILLQPQPQLVGNVMQLTVPPILLPPGLLALPAPQVINTDNSTALKIEPSTVLSNVNISQLNDRKTDILNSEIKSEKLESSMESVHLRNTEVHCDAVKTQEITKTKIPIICHEISTSKTEIERTTSTTYATTPIPEMQFKGSNPGIHKDYRIENNKDCTLTSINVTEACSVVVQDGFPHLSKPESIPGNSSESKPKSVLEEYDYSSASDREGFNTDNGDDDSGSDWEEEYLCETRKTNGKEIKKNKPLKIVKNIRKCPKNSPSMNKPCSDIVECSISEGNNITIPSVSKISKTTESSFIFTNNRIEKANKRVKEIRKSKVKNNICTPSVPQNYMGDKASSVLRHLLLLPKPVESLTASLVDTTLPSTSTTANENRATYVHCKDKSKNIAFQLTVPTTQNTNQVNMLFIPQSVETIKDKQAKPINKTNETEVVTNTKLIRSHNKKKVKSNIILPNKVQMNKTNVQTTKFKKILPKPRVASSTSKLTGTGMPAQYESEDNSDESTSSKKELLPQVPYTSYQCTKCNKCFEIVDQFIYHKKYSVCGGYRRKSNYQCDICGKSFPGTTKLQNHKNSHTNARPFKCSDCDKCFNSKIARHIHHRNTHLKQERKYLCHFCGYITPSYEHILAHENEHRLPEGTEAPKPFKCLVCDRGFISRYKEVRHRKEHQLKKCTECPEKFKSHKELRDHKEKVHSIIKWYDCKECGVKFKSRDNLRNHKKTHSNVLPYLCDICDKGFKRKGNLVQHMITHSDDRPISCPECGDKFKRYTHLKQHTAAFHGDGRKS